MTDGGSVTEWDDKYVFVAFTVTTKTSAYGGYAWVFQVDKYNASVVYSETRISRDVWGEAHSGLYRAVPYRSVSGEQASCPFGGEGQPMADNAPE